MSKVRLYKGRVGGVSIIRNTNQGCQKSGACIWLWV